MGIGERGKAAATDLYSAFRYINITMAFSRTLVLLMALMALVVSSVNANFCGKCLLDDSRIDTALAKKEFRTTLGPKSRGRCKVACRNISGFCSISGDVCRFDIFDYTSQIACGQLI